MITETPGNWYPGLTEELDAIWNMFSTQPEMNAAFYETVPQRPSEYMNRNLFLGASFTSPYEAEQAVLHGFESQLMWGSDYPHVEGTFVHPDGAAMPSVTRLALRNTFCNIPPEHTRRMIGENAIDVYDLDRACARRDRLDDRRTDDGGARYADRRRTGGCEPARVPLRTQRVELR